MVVLVFASSSFGESQSTVQIQKNAKGYFSYSDPNGSSFKEFPAFSKNMGQILYLESDGEGAESPRHLFLKFIDMKSLKVIKSVTLDIIDEIKVKETKSLFEVIEEIKKGQFIKMDLIGTAAWDGIDPSPGKKFNLEFQYSKTDGFVKITHLLNKKVVLKKQFQKLYLSCFLGPGSKSFPNTVTAWTLPGQSIFLFSISLVGAADSCSDATEIEIFRAN